MPQSTISVFGEPEDFETALRMQGFLSLLVTGRGSFHARLIQVSLDELHLSAAEERLPRIAFVAVPAQTVLILFSIGTARAAVCGGIPMRPDELAALGPGVCAHVRIDGACGWGTIFLPAERLVEYGSALTGTRFSPSRAEQHWRPSLTASRNLRSLHSAAIRMAAKNPQILTNEKAGYGLRQQLLHALVDCISERSPRDDMVLERRNQEIMVRFEQLLRTSQNRVAMSEACALLQVSDRDLRRLCREHLAMSPTSYDRLRRMSSARRQLRRGDPALVTVATVARLNGFCDPGRFSIRYRAMFGETPSATLHRVDFIKDQKT